MNKKIIKNIFDEKINKDKIHEEVIIKVENKRKVNLSNIIKLSVVPICAVIVMVVSLNIKFTNNTKLEIPNNNSNIININNINDVTQSVFALDFALMGDITHPSYKDLMQEFPWISKFKIPYNFDFNSTKQIYNYEDVEYMAYYLDYSINNSNISIYFNNNSESRPRCIRIIPDDLEDSTINGLNVKLYKVSNDYNNGYYAFFKLNELYFDIETKNITEEEFIELIESIIDSTN